MSAIVLTAKPFQLVNFTALGRPRRTRNVDITLLKWIRCDKKKLVTKYMPPPYNDETNDVLYDLLENQVTVPKDWPEYRIKIVGHAETYAEGVEKLNLLAMKEYAFTTDSEMNSSEKAVLLTNRIKVMEPLQNMEMDSIMQVPKLSDTNLPLLVEKEEVDPMATEDEIGSDTSSVDFQGNDTNGVRTGKHFSQNRCEPERKKRKIGCNYKPSYNKEKGSGRSDDERDYLNGELSNGSSEEGLPNVKKRPNDPKKRPPKQQVLSTTTVQINKSPHAQASTSKGIMYGHFIGHSSNIKPISTPKTPNSSKKINATSLTPDISNMILKEIRSLRVEVKDVAEQQKTLMLMMESMSDASYSVKKSFAEEYILDLPFKNIEEFKSFDNKLKTDEECTHRCKASLNSSFNKDTGLRKALKIIIQKYLSREVVMKFTVVKKVLGKEVFKDFQFCTCVLDVVRDKFLSTEEEVLSHMSTVFWNAKDWDGNRKQRSK